MTLSLSKDSKGNESTLRVTVTQDEKNPMFKRTTACPDTEIKLSSRDPH